jgi:hypothetical protein
MKSSKQWMYEKDPAWGDLPGKPELAESIIEEIQTDALIYAAMMAEKIGDSVGRDNPSTGELSEKDANWASGCYQVEERLRLEAESVANPPNGQ